MKPSRQETDAVYVVPCGVRLQGQAGVRYVLQMSPDLIPWTRTKTNVVAGNSVNITNPISPGVLQTFWRAVWQP
jgi:hypothetical protein